MKFEVFGREKKGQLVRDEPAVLERGFLFFRERVSKNSYFTNAL